MIIVHNIAALNARNQYGTVYGNQKKSLEKLSSGYRINRSADDAAGLAISENMRRQIKGLNQAVQNARDGISFCQTADGALTEVSSMIQRISTLSVQAANSVYSGKDRDCIQEEINQLMQEVDRIGKDTEFGGQKVFQNFAAGAWKEPDSMSAAEIFDLLKKGKMPLVTEDITLADGVGVLEADKANIMIKGMSAYAMMYDLNERGCKSTMDFYNNRELIKKVHDTINGYAVSLAGEIEASKRQNYLDALAEAKSYLDMAVAHLTNSHPTTSRTDIRKALDAYEKVYQCTDVSEGGINSGYNITERKSSAGVLSAGLYSFTVSLKQLCESRPHDLVFDSPSFEFAYAARTAVYQSSAKDTELYKYISAFTACSYPGNSANNAGAILGPNDNPFDSAHKNACIDGCKYAGLPVTSPDDGSEDEGGLWIQCGPGNKEGLYIHVGRMDTGVLGLQNLDLTWRDGASAAMEAAKSALDTLSSIRGRIGASQNRLEHTIDNLNIALENTTAAESRIRDTDMAEEIMNYVRNNINIQAGQSMLAQANSMPRNVLTLLGV